MAAACLSGELATALDLGSHNLHKTAKMCYTTTQQILIGAGSKEMDVFLYLTKHDKT